LDVRDEQAFQIIQWLSCSILVASGITYRFAHHMWDLVTTDGAWFVITKLYTLLPYTCILINGHQCVKFRHVMNLGVGAGQAT